MYRSIFVVFYYCFICFIIDCIPQPILFCIFMVVYYYYYYCSRFLPAKREFFCDTVLGFCFYKALFFCNFVCDRCHIKKCIELKFHHLNKNVHLISPPKI